MNKQIFFIGLLVCILPSCRQPSVKREFKVLQNEVQQRLDKTIRFSEIACLDTQENLFSDGLSRDRAIGIALEHNPMLQAHFQELGIAKADVVSAGLFTNPRIESIFNIPKSSSNDKIDIEFSASARLSDAWLVPLSKRVAQDVLCIVTQEVLQNILDVTYEVSLAYNECLAAYVQYKIASQTSELFKTFHDMFTYYFTYGYGDELIIMNSTIALHAMQAEVIEYHAYAKQACLNLKKTMGIEPTKQFIPLTDMLGKKIVLPEEKELELYALEYNPRIVMGNIKISQYEHQIALEKGKLFKDIDLAISYERDFDGSAGWGPSLGFSLPVFDQNQGEIMRARYLLQWACNELKSVELATQTEVRSVYEGIIASVHALEIYQKEILPLYDRAKQWAQHYNKRMQVDHFIILETQKSLYQHQIKYTHISKQLQNYYAQLERVLGKRLL